MTGLKLPKLGSTMDEGMIVAWHVDAGDTVQTGDVLYEVTTDKVNMEVEADRPLTVVKILAPIGANVAVGGEVALVQSDDDLGENRSQLPEPSKNVATSLPVPSQGDLVTSSIIDKPVHTAEEVSPVRASPASRQLARTLGIDLTTITGTGPRGRITRADVEAKTEELSAAAARPERVQREPVAWEGPRAVIAQRMSQSAHIPQVTLNMSVDMRSVIAFRAEWSARRKKVSVADFVLLAVSRMLVIHPGLNGWAENGKFSPAPHVDLGYAVDVASKGLYVVTVREANTLTLTQIAEQRQQRTDRVLNGRATLDDLGKPSFTITNLGPMGIEMFNPLLMPPQVAILGVGAIRSAPTEDRLMLSLTFDHRVIDGAPAAWALKQVKEFLEVPGLLL